MTRCVHTATVTPRVHTTTSRMSSRYGPCDTINPVWSWHAWEHSQDALKQKLVKLRVAQLVLRVADYLVTALVACL